MALREWINPNRNSDCSGSRQPANGHPSTEKRATRHPATAIPAIDATHPRPCRNGSDGSESSDCSGSAAQVKRFVTTRAKGARGCEDGKDQPPIMGATCAKCRHFSPSTTNPPAGLGACQIDAAGESPPWPNLARQCDRHHPTRAAVFTAAVEACDGSSVDPSRLTAWLIEQRDTGWLTPLAVQRWARLIASKGWPDDATAPAAQPGESA